MIGPIPAELASLSNLERLYLGGNKLTGEIPSELGGLSHLLHLYLGANQLTGEIPSELGNLSNLYVLSLLLNQLTGPIPAELGSLSNLQWLYLSTNQLTGQIPPELGGLSNLQHLTLSHNQLTGSIPTELASLSNLERLQLSDNQLTGCTPEGLRDVARNDFDDLGLPFCDVLLSGLTVSPGSLVPQFDPYRTDYSASVGLSPVTVTVIPTNDHDATFLFLDENDGRSRGCRYRATWRAFRSNSAPASPPSRSGSSHRTIKRPTPTPSQTWVIVMTSTTTASYRGMRSLRPSKITSTTLLPGKRQ